MPRVKSAPAPETAPAADVYNGRLKKLALDLLNSATPRQESAYGRAKPASALWHFLRDLTDAAGVDEKAYRIAAEAKARVLDAHSQSPEYAKVVELERRVDEVKGLLQEAVDLATRAEADYAQSLASEDEPAALNARRTAAEAAAKQTFQTERLARLHDALSEARSASREEANRQLRAGQDQLRQLWLERHRAALVELGRALEELLPDCLLFDRLDEIVRFWV
jgi:hypothetical protein